MNLELPPCWLCGMPVEVVSEWTCKGREMMTTRCVNGHWYGGPAGDVYTS